MISSFKKLNRFQLLLITGIALVIFRNTVFFEFEITGTYISNAKQPTLEMPGEGAELYLYKDGSYSSNSFMGKGTYILEEGVVKLRSTGNVGCHLPVLRKFNVGKPMLLINADWGYYFIKE